MGQVTIYLDAETEQKLNAIIANAGISKSRWIADLIRAKAANSWPDAIVQLAGAWKDLDQVEAIRADMGRDIPRESL